MPVLWAQIYMCVCVCLCERDRDCMHLCVFSHTEFHVALSTPAPGRCDPWLPSGMSLSGMTFWGPLTSTAADVRFEFPFKYGPRAVLAGFGYWSAFAGSQSSRPPCLSVLWQADGWRLLTASCSSGFVCEFLSVKAVHSELWLVNIQPLTIQPLSQLQSRALWQYFYVWKMYLFW